MRATKGYVAGVGTTSALVGAIGCAFVVLSAVVAVHGWPLTLSLPGASTVEDQGAAAESALPTLDVFPSAEGAADRDVRGGDGARGATTMRLGPAAADAAPVASAFGPDGGDRSAASGDPAGRAPTAGAAGPAPGSSAAQTGATPGPVGSGGSTTTSPPAAPGDGATTLGGTVTQVTSTAGSAVTQTGQQLGGTVQGATSQLGGVVGQVSPAAGQTLTQTGQVVGGVVSGATGTVGQVVSGAGTTAGGLLGGLTGGH